MKPAERNLLTSKLREHVARIAANLRAQMLAPCPARVRAEKLHGDEQVGEDFEVWTDLLSRRAAVLWVLKSVYVRVLEDRGLLAPGRLLDPESQQLFERLAPNLGETAFLKWVYRDLASRRGGLPELFGPQPAEVALPADVLSRELIEFWRHRNPDTNALWSFAEERFEGELMGDLYQDLDPVVKDRFALCQTPDFVREFMLDRTLTPAIETFGADTVRLLDPACGSGHFLIDGLKRLVAATGEQHKDWERDKLVAHCLNRVVGIDLNDYACALARSRLVMTASELAGMKTLGEAARWHPHVYWADGLEQVEKGAPAQSTQLGLFEPGRDEEPRASLTRPEVRAKLGPLLRAGFHAVLANPPYITEKDPARKNYHREKNGKARRYLSAYREYSLASPFTERCLQLAVTQGFIGLITSNNFMKRDFGQPLIEQVLATMDLSLVVDASKACIPNHTTPPVLLFGRNRRPSSATVRGVLARQGEPIQPAQPARGLVWTSILEGWRQPGFQNDFVTVADLPRTALDKHPWSMGGGGAAELRQRLEATGKVRLIEIADSIGFASISGADEIFLQPGEFWRRHCIGNTRTMVIGDNLRDWSLDLELEAAWPHAPTGEALDESEISDLLRFFAPYRSLLRARNLFSTPIEQRGLHWWEVREVYRDRLRTSLSIPFSFLATHNHFVFDRGGKLFNASTPIIKLPLASTEADHFGPLGMLNSSTACFWMKQVCHDKSGGGAQLKQSDPAKIAFEFAATRMRDFPIPAQALSDPKVARLAVHLDRLARQRAEALPKALPQVDQLGQVTATKLGHAIIAAERQEITILRVQVALQEELDWHVYTLYGLVPDPHPLDPDFLADSAGCPIGCRPFELVQARNGRAIGVDGQSLVTEIPPDVPSVIREAWQARSELLELPELALIEHEAYKRRWFLTPKYLTGRVETFQHRLRFRLRSLLADIVEKAAQARSQPAPAERLASDLQSDVRFLALAELYSERRDFDLTDLVATLLREESVPNHAFHRYSAAGLVKRAAWEKTWEDQRREDAGEAVRPEVPPSYVTADFLRPEFMQIRGKLDVPKERFIALTEVPGKIGTGTLYGWAGWTPLQRLKALLAIDEELEDAGVPLSDRTGLLDSAWRLLPDVTRDDPAAAARLKAEVQALVGPDGPSRERLDDWKKRFPPPGKKRPTAPRKPRKTRQESSP